MGRFISIDNINIEIVRKKGKKTISLKIDSKSGQPVISAPYLCTDFFIKSFVKKHLIWLKKSIQITPPKRQFQNGESIYLLGQKLTITHQNSHCITHIDGDKLIVGSDINFLHRRIKEFIKKQTIDYIQKKATELSDKIEKKVSKISLRDTTSRWGSCSSNGSLSFCWRLGLAPLFVLDYVIIHETAHLVFMDHSAYFWKLVKELNGQTTKSKKWLKENGAYLHSFL